MKKNYEAPSVEKIAFNYRDQVVVASGGKEIADLPFVDVASNGKQFVCRLLAGVGVDGCAVYECQSLSIFWA